MARFYWPCNASRAEHGGWRQGRSGSFEEQYPTDGVPTERISRSVATKGPPPREVGAGRDEPYFDAPACSEDSRHFFALADEHIDEALGGAVNTTRRRPDCQTAARRIREGKGTYGELRATCCEMTYCGQLRSGSETARQGHRESLLGLQVLRCWTPFVRYRQRSVQSPGQRLGLPVQPLGRWLPVGWWPWRSRNQAAFCSIEACIFIERRADSRLYSLASYSTRFSLAQNSLYSLLAANASSTNIR